MRRRMRANASQWKVLLVATRYPTGGSIREPIWDSYGHFSTTKPTSSYDDSMKCAFSHVEHTQFDTAYILDDTGLPVAAVFSERDAITVWRFGQPLWNATYPEAGWFGMVLQRTVYSYVRSRGGWETDGETAGEPVFLHVLRNHYMGDSYTTYPGYRVTLHIRSPLQYGRYPTDPRWLPLDVDVFRAAWQSASGGGFGRPVPEDE